MVLQAHGKLGSYRWLAVSLALHCAVLLPFVLFGLHTPPRQKLSRLQIELFGMVADRQLAEKKLQQQVTPPARPRPAHLPKPQPRKSPDSYRAAAAESPVSLVKVEEKEKEEQKLKAQPAPAQQAFAAQAPPVPHAAGAEAQQQKAQTISSAAEQEREKINRYLKELAKLLRSNLVYPEEMRRNGIEAVTTITFVITESGQIKGDTLRVKKSSGYPAFDANALNSARVGAPYQRPPKEITVSIAVTFSANSARRPRTT